MRTFKLITTVLILTIFTPFFAQESNVFLNREFWKTNPSVSIVKKKIKLGNNPAQLNNNAFDAMSYALIENVDNKTIKYLLKQPRNDVNKLTHDGRTFIFWAAYKGNLEMMAYLVSQGAKTDIIDSHGYSVASFAARSGVQYIELYEFLVKHGAQFSEEKNHDGANALLLVASSLNDFKLVEYFTSNGIDLNTTDNFGNGIFNYAAKGGNTKMLDRLIEKGISHKGLNKNGGNAMLFASQGSRGGKTNLGTYMFLEEKGIAANVIGENGRNPLHAISYNSEDLEIYRFFIKHGVDSNLQDNGGNSPFMNAANSNTLPVVKFLYSYVKDINAKDENGQSALVMAVNRNDVDIIDFLLKKQADINTVDNEENTLSYYLLNNFQVNNTKAFEDKLSLLKSNGLVINQTQNNGNTLLHIATERSNLELLKRLETFDIDINAKNTNGFTVLQIAAMKAKHQDILKYLIGKGADKTVMTDFDESVYDLANENELLQQRNIDINFLK
ncbi:ankyrin repeat domain-containing protein [Psychroserpens burtonensis]|uniref:Ankyrin repeat domain-containing protein n=1 Tax=Psychroserpens burtonensis TaxID=49278 RepID=A0A5C7B8Y7_9FLAO|nr:ankyrin repeat domain-containing protein [Psychroserpens burtonensis]TXE16905.1 ankyrin repeat domain-containing protein [Psychroserpens burtonensis]